MNKCLAIAERLTILNHNDISYFVVTFNNVQQRINHSLMRYFLSLSFYRSAESGFIPMGLVVA